jgi:2-polyprenyl-3-methyl-5-hydroxy-6-metoxy-1,4-benzoquinol methylase
MAASSYTWFDHVARDVDPYAAAKYRLTLDWLRRYGFSSDVIYNIGCGSGVFTSHAADAGFKVKAFEPDPSAYHLALRALPAGCTVEMLGLQEIDSANEAKVIVMHDVLEHLPDSSRAVAQLHRLLRPEGLLVVSVPALPFLFGYHDEQLGHYRRYTKRTLRDALGRHFQIVRIRYFGFTFIPVTVWFSKVRRKRYGSGSRGLLVRAFDVACRVEQKVPSPIGTSLLCLARPLPGDPGD